MSPRARSLLTRGLASVVLLLVVVGIGFGLAALKGTQDAAAAAAAAQMPEPAEAVEATKVGQQPYTRVTTAIGSVRALRSITLQNELAGTVRAEHLETGDIVEQGELLVEFDVAVEEAQLAALQAEARLAESMLGRMERALQSRGASEADVDRAQAERDMAVANVQRLDAIIEQKRLRAPFRARVGLVDLHVGQYLDPGTRITTLQSVDDAVHIDFAVTQDVATALAEGNVIEVRLAAGSPPVEARIVALDAQVDVETRNALIRAELRGVDPLPRPGSSVRVAVPVAAPRQVAVVPVSALRRGPGGSSVFVLAEDGEGALRAHERRVTNGTVLGDLVVIESGVEVGELVATTGSFKLREGALVALPRQDR